MKDRGGDRGGAWTKRVSFGHHRAIKNWGFKRAAERGFPQREDKGTLSKGGRECFRKNLKKGGCRRTGKD